MNPVFKAAADTAQMGWLMGFMTLVFLGIFAAWTWWAYRPANAARWEAAGRIPLDDAPGGEA